MSCAHGVALINKIDDLFLRGDEVLSEALDLDLLVPVFEDFQHFVVVKQVVDLAAINLIHRDCDGEVSLVILPVVDTSLEQVLYS